MRSSQTDVFLNVPYSPSYEKMLVALTAALVAVGCRPRLTFQIADGGQGRLRRIVELLRSCPVSIHDLSAVGLPPRFNMPFELGLACAIQQHGEGHRFLMLERKPHRLDQTLSDLKGIDPKIHHGRVDDVIGAVLDVLVRRHHVLSVDDVLPLHRYAQRHLVPPLKRRHHANSLFHPRIYGELVALLWNEAFARGILPSNRRR